MGFSMWHMIILLVIVLLIFGPSRLGDLGKSMGQAIRGFKKGLSEEPEIDVTDTTRREQLDEKKGTADATTTKSQNKDRV